MPSLPHYAGYMLIVFFFAGAMFAACLRAPGDAADADTPRVSDTLYILLPLYIDVYLYAWFTFIHGVLFSSRCAHAKASTPPRLRYHMIIT